MNPSRLSDSEIRRTFASMGAIHTDSHFVYTSGRHGSSYIDKDRIGLNPELTHRLAYELAERLKSVLVRAQIVAVVGAPMGAIRLSDHVCFWLNRIFFRMDGVQFKSIYADKNDDGSLVLKRGFPKIFQEGQGGQAICIEDVLNSGDSARALVSAVREAGGEPVALGALCNRGQSTAESLGVPNFVSLMDVQFDTYSEDELPDWLARIPVRTDIGHGAKWLEA